MPTEILMPALSPTMEEGKLAKWLVKEGQTIKPGDIIAEIETDKATMEVEAVDEGKVSKLLISEGTEGVKVNTPIAVLLAEGEKDGAPTVAKAPSAPAKGQASRAAVGAPRSPGSVPPPCGGRSGRGDRRTSAAVAPPTPNPSPHHAEGVSSTRRGGRSGGARTAPAHTALAQRSRAHRRFAAGAAAGQGGGDRSCGAHRHRSARAHRQARHRRRAPRAARRSPGPAPPSPGRQRGDGTGRAAHARRQDPGALREGLLRDPAARRHAQGHRPAPDPVEADHPALLSDRRLPHRRAVARARAHERGRAQGRPARLQALGQRFLIKALALALAQVPAANVTWTEAGTLRHKYADVGVAVAIEGGLFTPIIRHAELKSLSEISNEMRDLAERARKRRLAPHEYQGGTTSISNLGMYGIKSFDAVINPPHATILAVGAGEKRPVVAGDKVEVATIMSCTLSCDHRVVDGAVGAELLNAFKMLIEDPVRMLV